MKNFFIVLIFLTTTHLAAQNKIYQAEREKVHNLIHTKLKVDFNFEKSQLNGEAWITLTPHFYPTSKLTLDAKSFKIISISFLLFLYSSMEISSPINNCKRFSLFLLLV